MDTNLLRSDLNYNEQTSLGNFAARSNLPVGTIAQLASSQYGKPVTEKDVIRCKLLFGPMPIGHGPADERAYLRILEPLVTACYEVLRYAGGKSAQEMHDAVQSWAETRFASILAAAKRGRGDAEALGLPMRKRLPATPALLWQAVQGRDLAALGAEGLTYDEFKATLNAEAGTFPRIDEQGEWQVTCEFLEAATRAMQEEAEATAKKHNLDKLPPMMLMSFQPSIDEQHPAAINVPDGHPMPSYNPFYRAPK